MPRNEELPIELYRRPLAPARLLGYTGGICFFRRSQNVTEGQETAFVRENVMPRAIVTGICGLVLTAAAAAAADEGLVGHWTFDKAGSRIAISRAEGATRSLSGRSRNATRNSRFCGSTAARRSPSARPPS